MESAAQARSPELRHRGLGFGFLTFNPDQTLIHVERTQLTSGMVKQAQESVSGFENEWEKMKTDVRADFNTVGATPLSQR